MFNYILGIIQGVISSAVFAWISNLYIKSKKKEPVKRNEKFIKGAKAEFYIAFFVTLLLTALPTSQYGVVNDSIRALTFISLGFTLMGFMCISEIVKPTEKDTTNDDTSDISDENLDK